MIDEVSIIVQGPIVPETREYLLKTRQAFPNAELILSTWEGSCVDDLTYDTLVLSKDPGAPSAVSHPIYRTKNNVNRQIVSTLAGLRKASRKIAIKIRTDFCLLDSCVLGYFDAYPKSVVGFRIFSHKVITCSVFSREFSDTTRMPCLYHPSDLFYLGYTEDLLLLFENANLTSDQESCQWQLKYPQLEPYTGYCWRYTPEQSIFLGVVRKFFPDVKFADWSDYSEAEEIRSKKILYSNFVFLNPDQISLYSLKHEAVLRLGSTEKIPGLITNRIFEMRYKELVDPNFFIKKIKPNHLQRAQVHFMRFWSGLHICIRFLMEPLHSLYHLIMHFFRRFF